MKTITVVGGGNSAHTLIPLLSKTGMKVNLLTRKSELWADELTLDYIRPSGEYVRSFSGKLDKVSSDPGEVIPEADFIILCLPVHIYRLRLHFIAPFINKDREVYIGTVFGQGGFNWMTGEIRKKFDLVNIRTFAIGLIPWVCRTEEYGKKGIVYGAKPVNVAAVEPKGDFGYLNEMILDSIAHDWFGHGKFKQADNFISLTMSVDNQILHTSRMYGLYLEYDGQWEKEEDVPYFYSEFSEISLRILRGLDEDYTKIRNGIRMKFPDRNYTYMLDYIGQDNKTNLKNNRTYLDTFSNSGILARIKPPLVQSNGKLSLDFGHRFLTDDVFYGLCIAKAIAQTLRIRTYHIDKTLSWAQKVMGERLIRNRKLIVDKEIKIDKFKFGIPKVYGRKKIEEICD